MSNNIVETRYLSGTLSIKRSEAIRLREELEDWLPEVNFLNDIGLDGPEEVMIETPTWCGEFSGCSYFGYLCETLKRTKGRAELLHIWEDGQMTGLLVDNGLVIKKKVRITLE